MLGAESNVYRPWVVSAAVKSGAYLAGPRVLDPGLGARRRRMSSDELHFLAALSRGLPQRCSDRVVHRLEPLELQGLARCFRNDARCLLGFWQGDAVDLEIEGDCGLGILLSVLFQAGRQMRVAVLIVCRLDKTQHS